LSNKIHFLGRLESQEDLYSYYKHAMCFVLPSITKNENFGVVQLEAMYFDLPLIVTNIKSGVPVVGIPNKTTLLVEPSSSEELSIAIKKLQNDKSLRLKLGKEGKKLFLEKYTFKKMINGHIQAYLQAINEK